MGQGKFTEIEVDWIDDGTIMAEHQNMATPSQIPQNESLSLPVIAIVQDVVAIIGEKLTAYIVADGNEDLVLKWLSGDGMPSPEAESKLRFVFRVVKPLYQSFGAGVARAWLQGTNPELNGSAAIDLIRNEDLHHIESNILTAENMFLEYQL